MLKYTALFICLVIFSCNTNNNKNSTNQEANAVATSEGIAVSTQIITTANFNKEILANGLVEALEKTEVRFNSSERIASIYVKNGQKVTRGQKLAELDNALLANQVQKVKIELDKANSKFQEEKINYGLGKQLENGIDAAKLRNLKILSGVYEAENALENAQLLYNQTILKAPFSGIVANIEVKTGNFITSSDIFCTLINERNLEVVFSIVENELKFLTQNQTVTIIPFVDDAVTYQGNITEINPLVDENGLIQIKASLKTNGTTLFDGMNVRVTASQPIKDVVVIPKQALVLRSNREVVFTYENGLAKWNYVKILDENSNSYALKEGLKIGDSIIVSGNMNLAHDAKVNRTALEGNADN